MVIFVVFKEKEISHLVHVAYCFHFFWIFANKSNTGHILLKQKEFIEFVMFVFQLLFYFIFYCILINTVYRYSTSIDFYCITFPTPLKPNGFKTTPVYLAHGSADW